MNIEWSRRAAHDVERLRDYITEADPATAQRIAAHIINLVETVLASFPESGRPGRVIGTREAVVPRTPFIVPYRVQGDTLTVLRVYHQSQNWPDVF